MVVQEGEKNSADQRHIEYRLFDKHRVPLVRHSLSDVHALGKLNEETRVLTMYEYDIHYL